MFIASKFHTLLELRFRSHIDDRVTQDQICLPGLKATPTTSHDLSSREVTITEILFRHERSHDFAVRMGQTAIFCDIPLSITKFAGSESVVKVKC